ncbi:M20/M25/M40 family metallo-hydrolase [Lysobacter capsici]|uniref:M20/M25/M40 family metallo-hydrolase n=1 Tax=Lysobacter capsici TaxID=435897 RepID=UPI00287BA69C|nr:M20/M25/M40 family metallo-hydrolase [Lysobacter capsici]WND79229.1 M20/M25/M40 family metallo-hydrolase [Lysobacter capsici]WND84424.1 M20/M25/M40 family metallo-hydrolase [Lysobacter capsici]
MQRSILLSLSLLSLAALAPAFAQADADRTDLARITPAHVDPAPAGAHSDPFKPVYVVTSRQTHDAGLSTLARNASARVARSGAALVVSELQTHQLTDLSRHVHEKERRCGGYFAFDSRAEAEAFVRNDRSAEAMTTAFASYAIDNQATVTPWLGQVSEANIRATIQSLSSNWPNRHASTSHGRNAATWVRDRWAALGNGRGDVSTELFNCSGCGSQPSVILTIRGNELPNEVVVLGAHLDTISNSGSGETMRAPGADDDASGIATLTEVLRIAMANGYRPKRTIKLMGYAAEEIGLRGSKAIAADFKARGVNVVGVLQLDMTNYRTSTAPDVRVINDFSNAGLQQLLRDLFATYLGGSLRLGSYTCNYGCSDHASWTAAGYPAAMYFEGGNANGGYSPYIHTANDTLASVGQSAQASVPFAKLGLAFLGEVGKTAGR